MKLSDFYTYLKKLPNTSGYSIYFIETDQPEITWNSAQKKLEILHDTRTGYRKYSICTCRDMTTQEVDDMEYMVEHNSFLITEYFKYQNKRVILHNGFTI